MTPKMQIAYWNKCETCILFVSLLALTNLPYSCIRIQTETFNNNLTAPWARRGRYTWQWASARHRPCARPGPCWTSWARRPWCRCNGRTGTWGTSCGGRSSAPGGDLYTTGTVRLAERGWGPPSCWNKTKKELKWVFACLIRSINCETIGNKLSICWVKCVWLNLCFMLSTWSLFPKSIYRLLDDLSP